MKSLIYSTFHTSIFKVVSTTENNISLLFFINYYLFMSIEWVSFLH